jgi:hypothetical protein
MASAFVDEVKIGLRCPQVINGRSQVQGMAESEASARVGPLGAEIEEPWIEASPAYP